MDNRADLSEVACNDHRPVTPGHGYTCGLKTDRNGLATLIDQASIGDLIAML